MSKFLNSNFLQSGLFKRLDNAVTRYLHRLSDSLSQYYEIKKPIVLGANDFSIQLKFNTAKKLTAFNVISGTNAAEDTIYIDFSGSQIRVWAYVGTTLQPISSVSQAAYTDGKNHTLLLTYDSGTGGAELFIDSVSVDTRTWALDGNQDIANIARKAGSSNYFDGIIFDLEIYDDGVLVLDMPLDKDLTDSAVIVNRATTLGAELVANGTNITTTDDWSEARSVSALSVVGGNIRATSDGTDVFGPVTPITCVIGESYRAQISTHRGDLTGALFAKVSSSSILAGNVAEVQFNNPTDGSVDLIFTATATTMYIGALASGHGSGQYFELGNVSVKQADGYGMAINSPVSKKFTQVETGWEGEELITQAVWETPPTAQEEWAFVDDQWILTGTGGSSVLKLIATASQPDVMRLRGNCAALSGGNLRTTSGNISADISAIGLYEFDIPKSPTAFEQLYKRASGSVNATIDKPSLKELLENA